MGFLVFIILGIVLIVTSFVRQDYHKELLKSGIRTQGIIFDQSAATERGLSTNTLLNTDTIVRFTTEEKTWVTGAISQDFATFFTGQYRVGQKVEVFYDPLDPSRFYVKTRQSSFAGRVLMFVVGVVFLLLGLYQYPSE